MKLTGLRLERFTPILANETDKDARVHDFLVKGGGDILAIAEAHAVAKVYHAMYHPPMEGEMEEASEQALSDTERYLLPKISTGKARDFIVVQTTTGTHTFSGSLVEGIYSAKPLRRSTVWMTYSRVFRNSAIEKMCLEFKFMGKKTTGCS
eukprot:g9089.t3